MRFPRWTAIGLAAFAVCTGVTSLAVAGVCRPVEAVTGPMTYDGACTHEGVEYAYCISANLRGTLSGEYRFYGAVDDWVEANPGDPVTNPPYSVRITDMKPPRHEGILAGWGLEVFHTKRGDLITHTAFTFPLGIDGGIYGGASRIVGGTGHYKGATGWLTVAQNEAVSTLFVGKVCWP